MKKVLRQMRNGLINLSILLGVILFTGVLGFCSIWEIDHLHKFGWQNGWHDYLFAVVCIAVFLAFLYFMGEEQPYQFRTYQGQNRRNYQNHDD